MGNVGQQQEGSHFTIVARWSGRPREPQGKNTDCPRHSSKRQGRTSATPSGARQMISSSLQEDTELRLPSMATLMPKEVSQDASGREELGPGPAPKLIPRIVMVAPSVGMRGCRGFHKGDTTGLAERVQEAVKSIRFLGCRGYTAATLAGLQPCLDRERTGVTVRLEGGWKEKGNPPAAPKIPLAVTLMEYPAPMPGGTRHCKAKDRPNSVGVHVKRAQRRERTRIHQGAEQGAHLDESPVARVVHTLRVTLLSSRRCGTRQCDVSPP